MLASVATTTFAAEAIVGAPSPASLLLPMLLLVLFISCCTAEAGSAPPLLCCAPSHENLDRPCSCTCCDPAHGQHDLTVGSVNAVTTFINGARANNYTLVSISECLWGADYKRHPSYVYQYRNCPSTTASWPAPTAENRCPVSEWCVRACV